MLLEHGWDLPLFIALEKLEIRVKVVNHIVKDE